MEMHRVGRTVAFSGGVSVLSWGSIGGKLEGQGPLGSYFDEIEVDSFCGQASWGRRNPSSSSGRWAMPCSVAA